MYQHHAHGFHGDGKVVAVLEGMRALILIAAGLAAILGGLLYASVWLMAALVA